VGPGRGRSEFGQAGAEVEGCWEGKKGKENGRGDLLFSFLGEESFLFFSGLGWDLAWDLGWAGTGWKKEKGKWARNLFFSGCRTLHGRGLGLGGLEEEERENGQGNLFFSGHCMELARVGIELAVGLAESGSRAGWTRAARRGRAQEMLCGVKRGWGWRRKSTLQRQGMVWHGTDAGGAVWAMRS